MTPPKLWTTLATVVTLAFAASAGAVELTGRVAAGVVVDHPRVAAARLARGPAVEPEDLLFVAWTALLDGTADLGAADAVRDAGARPWVRAVLTTPAPVADNLDGLEAELAGLASLAGAAGGEAVIQVLWAPSAGEPSAQDHGYVLKRAAVAVTGALTGATFAAGPLPRDPERLAALYAEEVAAYLDVVVLAPGDGLEAALAAVAELDPGKPAAVDALPWPATPSGAVASVAAAAAAGFEVVLLDAVAVAEPDLAPLAVAARQLEGSLVADPSAAPTGAGPAWAFVREDLSLRVVAEPAPGADRMRLVFPDPTLRGAELVDLATGEARPVTGVRRGGEFVVVVDPAPELALLRLERATVEELDAFGEEIDVGGGRQMPVEEILRRLQAFEDDQQRRLDHYSARRTMNLRFQGRQGSIEVTYAGDAFFRDDTFDWVWSEFYVGGVRWRSRKLPKVPLIQPEKVASQPIRIKLEKDYAYRLRGTETVDGRDCWVVDFKPVGAVDGRSLYQGTVWVDREVYARVRTRAVQIGLEGDVLSNEETYFWRPVDVAGEPVAWSDDAFVLPLRVSGQQVFSILNATVPVEVEIRLENVRINGDDFEARRSAALASDATMLTDTDQGLRYLNQTKSGERVVETEFDSSRLFLLGGVLWDESLDFPIPAVGVNYLDLDFKDSGAQLNVFFAGVFLTANIADPDFLGTRWNAGANVSGRVFQTTDELYRDGEVVPEEEVRRRSGSFNLFAGRPIGKFLSLELGYEAWYQGFDSSDETADDFVLPESTITHGFEASLDYNRAGYRISVGGELDHRATWAPWGLPGNDEYDPAQQDYRRWKLTAAKTWWLPEFRKINLALEYLDSSDTDRFSGFDFGLFGDSTVGGYQSGLVRAEQAWGGHLTVGVNYLELIRLTASADAMWASNETTGLDNELLAGVGIGGTLALPWQVLVNFDVGYAVAGPGKGNVALRVFFLKLFPGS